MAWAFDPGSISTRIVCPYGERLRAEMKGFGAWGSYSITACWKPPARPDERQAVLAGEAHGFERAIEALVGASGGAEYGVETAHHFPGPSSEGVGR